MIERMKKITLIVSEKERAKFVSRLQEAGILHVKFVEEPVHHEIHFLEDKIARINRMISIVSSYVFTQEEGSKKDLNERDILENTERVEDAYREKETMLNDIEELKRKISWFEPWGEFEPEDLKILEQKGINIRLYRLKKEEIKKLHQKEKYYVIKRERGYTYVVFIARGDNDEVHSFEPVQPPSLGPEKMRQKIEEKKKRIAEIDSLLKEEAKALESIKRIKIKLQKEHNRLSVRFGMKEEVEFAYLQGFCPGKAVNKITSMAKRQGIGYLVEDPDNPEETPTLITNPRWIQIINPVFKFMNILPGYNEFDISFYFLIFFSLFFAMLIGDAGYGMLFLLITFLARRKFRNLRSEPFFLMYVLSVGTILWGAVTGTWFGAERIAQFPLLNSLIVGKIDSFADNNQGFLIFICFLIGAVHLTAAHILRALRVINSVKAFAETGWILILWGMFFAAGKFVIGNAFPFFGLWLFGVGITCVLMFSNPEKGILKGALISLTNLPLSVISTFSDIVSYLRLFAVGYASVVLAESFNNMALAGGVNSIISALGAAFILFFGHALNIILGFMAVIVHGIRLNMLEFSGHLGMQWSGRKYEPFCE